MKSLAPHLKALVFDYGNTLIEFGPDQVESCDRALSHALAQMFGAHDFERLSALQHHERRSPYAGEFIENDLRDITKRLVRTLFETDPNHEQLDELLEVRFQAMTSAVRVERHVHELLERLSQRYRLGLISNYPCSRSINHSLKQHHLDRWFEAIVVSADHGRVKPHPSLFEALTNRMEIAPEHALFVGDNWLGDIQGAKRFGMRAALTTQYVPYEKFDRQPGDHEPDVKIGHLLELAGLLD